MTVKKIEEISLSTRIQYQDEKIWVNSSWLDGDTVKPRWVGKVAEKLEGRAHWQQPKNTQDRYAYTNTTRLFIS